MMKFKITTEWSEKRGRHTITETYVVSGDKNLKKTLASVLDMSIDPKTGFPAEPSMEHLEQTLLPYSDREYVDGEFKRMKRMWKLYSGVMKIGIAVGSTTVFSPGRNWSVTIEALP